MDAHVLKIFRGEVRQQCEHALMAHCDLRRALDERQTDRVWYSIHAFLAAAANLSKLLWPSENNKHAQERGTDLRDNLGVHENSPLEARDFRNNFEHFDDRLDKWARSTVQGNFVDSSIGVWVSGIDPKDHLRNFDPPTLTLTFRGEEHPLEPVIEAIQQLHDAATRT